MKKYFEILRQCPLFENIEDENLSPMLSCLGMTVKTFDKNEFVMSEGEPARYVGILLTGNLQIESTDYFGNRSVVGNVLPTGLFAESFACAASEAIPVDVVATEKSEVALLHCGRILTPCCNACGFHSKIIFNLVQIIAAKNLRFHEKLTVTSRHSTREKLMCFLNMEAKRRASRSFVIPYDRQALADYLGVDRSGLSVEIGKLQREGIIESRKNFFKLL